MYLNTFNTFTPSNNNNQNFIIMGQITILAPNQFFMKTEKKLIFQSYQTIVCEITNFEDGNHPVIKIKEGQPQSKTTAKYLNQFLDITIGIDNYKKVNYSNL